LFLPCSDSTQLVDCARIRHGQSVLDVACGTGVVARTARDVVGPGSRVLGVDLNPAMLEVARDARPDLEWVPGDAEELPFADAEFNVALAVSEDGCSMRARRGLHTRRRIRMPRRLTLSGLDAARPRQRVGDCA
jgi:SAM-dependent methyltransferase